MLNKSERYQVLKFLKFCSIVGLLPIQVDLAGWQLIPASNRKRYICHVSYGLFLLHALYKNGSLAYAFIFVPDVPLYQLIIHTVLAMGSGMPCFWYYVAYIRDHTLFASYFKLTLLGNIEGLLEGNDHSGKHWKTRLREYSLQDLAARCLPNLVTLAILLITLAYIYDPSMRLLLYAALPGHLQTWTTFGLCLLEEFRFIMMFVITSVPILQLQIIFFDLVSNQLQEMIRKIQNGTQRDKSTYLLLRCLQLNVSKMNEVNSYIIFTSKLVSISVCIMCGYGAIAHFGEHPVFGVMYYDILFNCMFIYALIFERAFKIPQLFDQATKHALLRMRGNGTPVLSRQLLSIPPIGVQVGHFHKMERVSTLIFVDFVLTNIVSMLVAYG